MSMYNDFIEHIKGKPQFQQILARTGGRSDVRITPTFPECIVTGLPKTYNDIIILLLVQDLLPEEFSTEMKLWKDHLVSQRKWTLDQRILFRTFSPSMELQKFHMREIYGNIVPRALKLLANIRYKRLRAQHVNTPQRKRGYTDQGSAAPYDKKARTEAVYSKYETMNQIIAEDTDDLALLLGPAELLNIEEHIGIRISHLVSKEGTDSPVGTKIPQTRPTLKKLSLF